MRKLYLLLALALIVTLAGCGERHYGDYAYSDFERLDHWDTLEDIGHDDYAFIYVYNRDFLGNETPGTQLINEDIFKFGMENDFGYPMYRINQREVSGPRPENVQRRDPKLLIMRHGTLVDKFYGALPIMEFLDAIANDRYVFPEKLGLLPEATERFSDYGYDDFNHLRTWRQIHTLGRTSSGAHAVELVYVYHRDAAGTAETMASINEMLFPYAASEDLPLWLANKVDTIGLLPETYDHTAPTIMVIVNENIVALHEGYADVMAFVEALILGDVDLDEFIGS